MPYMAVGSRQVLFSDSIAPALPNEGIAETGSLEDNPESVGTAPVSESPEAAAAENPPPESGSVGARVDVHA